MLERNLLSPWLYVLRRPGRIATVILLQHQHLLPGSGALLLRGWKHVLHGRTLLHQ